MIFERFNPKIHNANDVAILIYDVDYRTFDMFFKNKEKAISAIEKNLVKEFKDKDENSLFYVILDENNNIIGMISLYVNQKPKLISEAKGLFKNLNFIDASKLFLVSFLDSFVLCDIKNKDLYLAEIAISSSQRGNGLGKKVIKEIIDESKKKGFKRVILDADFRNKGAYSLYKSLGFKTFNKKNFKLFGFERGMSNMEFVLE